MEKTVRVSKGFRQANFVLPATVAKCLCGLVKDNNPDYDVLGCNRNVQNPGIFGSLSSPISPFPFHLRQNRRASFLSFPPCLLYYLLVYLCALETLLHIAREAEHFLHHPHRTGLRVHPEGAA